MTTKPRTRIEDAISLPVDGPPTLEQWKRIQATAGEPKHIVRHQAGGKAVGE